MVHGQPLALAAYSQELSLLLSLVFTGIGASLSRSEQAFFPLALLEIALLFIVSFLGAQIGAASLLPLILARCCSAAARPAFGRGASCRCAAILAATALLHAAFRAGFAGTESACPARPPDARRLPLFSPTRARPFRSARRATSRSASLSSAGLPTRRIPPVMQVRTSGARCFAARSKTNTTATLGRIRRPAGAICMSIRAFTRSAAICSIKTPERRDSRAAPRRGNHHRAHARRRGQHALPHPALWRSRGMKSCRIFPRPARSSARAASPSATATFTGLRLSGDTPGIREAVLAAAHHSDAYADTVRADYLALPDGVETGVYALAGEITQDTQTGF